MACNMNKEELQSNNKIGLRVLILIVAVLLLIAAAELFAFSVFNGHSIKEQNTEYLIGNTEQVSKTLDNALSEGYRNIGVLADLLELSLDGTEVDVAQLRKLLDNSVYDFVEFCDTEGNDHNTTGGVSDARDREYYLNAMRGNSGMEIIYNSRATHETLLMFYSPVHHENQVAGSIIGVYQASNRLAKYLDVSYFGEKATLYLINPEGRVVASNFGIDTTAELYAAEVARECGVDSEIILKAMETGETCIFDTDNDSSGCIMRLKKNGWYLVQLFPQEVQKRLVYSSNRRAISLTAGLLLVYLAIAFAVISFARRRAKLMEAQRTTINHFNNIINTLVREYTSVFEVNLDTSALTVYKVSDRIIDLLSDSFKRNDYATACNIYVDDGVCPEERAEMREAFSVPYIKKHLEGVSGFTKTYLNNDLQYTEMKVVRIDGTDSRVVMGFGVKDEEIRREKEREEVLKKALMEAEAATKAKSTFLFSMSHDIRTPMNAILGYTALAKNHLDEKSSLEDYLGKIDISGRHMLTLVNQVLDMSRIESGRAVLEKMRVDLVERVRAIMAITEVDAHGRGVKVSSEIINLAHRYVLADMPRMNQVIINIFGNAIKYTPAGGSVTLTLQEGPCTKDGFAAYTISVADTGIGMSPEYLSHIYESFSRESTTTKSGIEGTGLGMSIVKRIVDLMGGTIDIQSERGKGTIVSVSLELEITDSGSGEEPCGDRTDDLSTADLTGRRLLLVEDNELNREIAEEILNENGFVVETAEDGDIAVEMVKKAEPGYYDAVLMDIQMPRMNGYEATKAIRAMDKDGVDTLPIIAMTANAFEEDKRNALEAGMNAHIAKPLDILTLMNTLARHLRRYGD